MKKYALLILMVGLISQSYALRAEESPSPSESVTPSSDTPAFAAPNELAPAALSETPETAPPPPPPAETIAPPIGSDTPTEAAPAATTTATAPAAVSSAPATSENLEFVSGEVTSTDEAAKTVTVKLYGETENAANDKILTIKLDENTDITDGEKDRDIKSLANGTEVDVEYDPATSKATYIFVY